MHASVIRGSRVLMQCMGFLPRVKILENKWWARLVPAAAVTPAPQVAASFIGSKASVAGLLDSL